MSGRERCHVVDVDGDPVVVHAADQPAPNTHAALDDMARAVVAEHVRRGTDTAADLWRGTSIY